MSVTGPLYIIMMDRLLTLVVKLLRQLLYASRVLFFVLVKSVLNADDVRYFYSRAAAAAQRNLTPTTR